MPAPELVPQVASDFDRLVGAALLILLGAFVARLPDLDLRLGITHRGVTHSLVAAAFVTAVVASVAGLVLPAAALELAAVTGAAYASHLVADSVNPTPVAILWPLPRYRPRWLPAARESSLAGRAVEAVVWVVILGLVAWRIRMGLGVSTLGR